jgi:hypothetical protein
METLFNKSDSSDSFYFYDDGTISVSCYSYEIASSGMIELSEKEVYELYLQLDKYFKNKVAKNGN